MIHGVLQRVNVSITKLRGQCYDGASSMSGYKSGVATVFHSEEPRAVYTHCYVHALSLTCRDTTQLIIDLLSPKAHGRLKPTDQQVAIHSILYISQSISFDCGEFV